MDRSAARERPRHAPDEERRLAQREKQISYGFNTDGYRNMNRLIRVDPRLANGGVLPIQPPSSNLRSTKRTWDVLVRKWRRALHMFDHVFIDGEDNATTTLDAVVALQRREWVRDEFKETPPALRLQRTAADLMQLKGSDRVPRKIPVEDDLIQLLRSPDCFERPLSEAIEEASPQHAATLTRVRHSASSITPTNCGIKVMVSAGHTSAMYPVVPRTAQSPTAAGKGSDFSTASWSREEMSPTSLDARFATALARPKPIVSSSAVHID